MQKQEESICEFCNHPKGDHEIPEPGEGSGLCLHFDEDPEHESCKCDFFSEA